MGGVAAGDLVFLDEFGAATNMARARGRCPRGERLVAAVPHGHWKVLTGVVALTAGGVFAGATIDGPVDAAVFRAFVTDALVPALRPGQVVVMDNLAPHKAPGVREAVEAAGCRVLYLPPYSPDYNPSENLIAKAKAHLRKLARRTVDALGHAVREALSLVTAADCAGFFRHCGYDAT